MSGAQSVTESCFRIPLTPSPHFSSLCRLNICGFGEKTNKKHSSSRSSGGADPPRGTGRQTRHCAYSAAPQLSFAFSSLVTHRPTRHSSLSSQSLLHPSTAVTVPSPHSPSLYCSHSSLSSQSLPYPSTAVTVPSPHSPSRIPLLQSQFPLLTVPPSTAVTVPSPHSPSCIPLLQSQFPLLTVPPAFLFCSHSSLSSQFRPLPFSILTKRNEDVAVDVELNCYTSGQ